ncbi:hypothetical protein D3C78_1521380 [compost metagenome]
MIIMADSMIHIQQLLSRGTDLLVDWLEIIAGGKFIIHMQQGVYQAAKISVV